MTVKGQIVIPAPLRKKYRIEPHTEILLIDDGERIALKPVDVSLIDKLCGSLVGLKLSETLSAERAKDQERENDKVNRSG